MKLIILVLCCFISFLNNANAGTMYNCIDRNGNTIFTDIPQDGMKCDLKSDDIRPPMAGNGLPDYNNANRNKSSADDTGGDCREKIKAIKEPMGVIINDIELGKKECEKGNTKGALEYLQQSCNKSRILATEVMRAGSSCTNRTQKKVLHATAIALNKLQVDMQNSIPGIRDKGCPDGGSVEASRVIAQPSNEIPMYGGIQKSEAMKKADAELIASFEKSGYSRQSAAEDAIRKAWRYFHTKDYSNAIKRFNQAWLLDPENGDCYHGFALIVFERDKAISEAEKYFNMALSKSRTSVNAYVDYGRFLWGQNRYNESLIQLYKAIKISPKAYNACSNISFVYYKKGDFIQACKWATAAKDNNDELEPGYLEAMCRRVSD